MTCIFRFTVDDTLTKQYVCAAVETVSVAKDAKSFPYGEDVKLEYCLDLPISVARKLREQYSNNDEYKEKLVEFWLETSPYASWDCLARKLRYYGQEKALEKVKDHVKIKEGNKKRDDTGHVYVCCIYPYRSTHSWKSH